MKPSFVHYAQMKIQVKSLIVGPGRATDGTGTLKIWFDLICTSCWFESMASNSGSEQMGTILTNDTSIRSIFSKYCPDWLASKTSQTSMTFMESLI